MAGAKTPKAPKKTATKEADPTDLPAPPSLIEHHFESFSKWAQKWVEQGQVSQSVLFVGPRGIGKRTLGLHLAQALLCERGPFGSNDTDPGQNSFFGDEPTTAPTGEKKLAPCGECASCLRALKNQ